MDKKTLFLKEYFHEKTIIENLNLIDKKITTKVVLFLRGVETYYFLH